MTALPGIDILQAIMRVEQQSSINVDDVLRARGRFQHSVDSMRFFTARLRVEAAILKSPIATGGVPRSLKEIVEAGRKLEKLDQRLGKVPSVLAKLQTWITRFDEAKQALENTPVLDETLDQAKVEVNEARINLVNPIVAKFVSHQITPEAPQKEVLAEPSVAKIEAQSATQSEPAEITAQIEEPPTEDTKFLMEYGRRRTALEIAYVCSYVMHEQTPPDIKLMLKPYRSHFNELFAGMALKKVRRYKKAMRDAVLGIVNNEDGAIALLEKATGDNIKDIIDWMHEQTRLRTVEMGEQSITVEFDDGASREEVDRVLTALGVISNDVASSQPAEKTPVTIVLEGGKKHKRNGDRIDNPQSRAKIRELIASLPPADTKTGKIEETKLWNKRGQVEGIRLRRKDIDLAVEKGIVSATIDTDGHHYLLTPQEALRVAYYIKHGRARGIDKQTIDKTFDSVCKQIMDDLNSHKTPSADASK